MESVDTNSEKFTIGEKEKIRYIWESWIVEIFILL
jgi:hypothetical protein